MADLRRVTISVSERELEMLIMAVTIGKMTLASGETLSMSQTRALDRVISKVIDAEKRMTRGVQSDD
mgnify:CR=1 FL=1